MSRAVGLGLAVAAVVGWAGPAARGQTMKAPPSGGGFVTVPVPVTQPWSPPTYAPTQYQNAQFSGPQHIGNVDKFEKIGRLGLYASIVAAVGVLLYIVALVVTKLRATADPTKLQNDWWIQNELKGGSAPADAGAVPLSTAESAAKSSKASLDSSINKHFG